MLVQTFEVTEFTTDQKGSEQIDEESRELIETLGMDGQRIYAGLDYEDRDGEKQEGSGIVIPYAQMTAEELGVYQTLFPTRTEVSSYSAAPIPLRVLQVIAHAKEVNSDSGESMFERLEVWHAREPDPDPLLVGIFNYSPYALSSQRNFLLARWGEALEEFSVQRDRAVQQLRAKRKQKLAECLAEVQVAIETCDSRPASSLLESVNDHPAFYGK